jgi:drug/metabolite transporter (DMT)-like permease
MPATALALALTAAFVHACWNLLLARARDSEAATAVAMVVAVVVFAPVAAATWRVEESAWPYIVASGTFQLLYFALLARAYRSSALSLVYPLARGLAPVLVLGVGVIVLDTGTSGAQVAGVLLVACGVLLIRGPRRDVDSRGVLFGVAIAMSIAAYTLVDKRGITHASAIPYLEVVMIWPTAAYAAVLAARRGGQALRAELNAPAAIAGVASFGAYVLVLLALRLASAASVAAVRETSVLIATALAARLLRERVSPGRVAGAALVVAGIALVTLG